MNEKEIWNGLTSGMFWASGSVIYNPQGTKFVQSFPFNKDGIDYHLAGWDTSVSFGNQPVNYTPDSEAFYYQETTMFRPSLKQCLNSFSGLEEKNFVVEAFNRAYTEMKKHCAPDYFASVMLLGKPRTSVPMHKHTAGPNLSFTYIVSSNTSKPNTSISAMTQDGQITIMNYPERKEFFTLLNTGLPHGTRSLEGDDNYYMYFVFDGITLIDSSAEFNKIYTV